MTILRRLAQKIAGFVVRHASPQSKQWAEGLAREGDFIENDWRALRWAFGSGRVLFDYYVPRPGWTLDELTVAAEKFAELKRRKMKGAWIDRNVPGLMMLYIALSPVRLIYQGIGGGDIYGRETVGYGILLAGFLMLAIPAFLQNRKLVVPQQEDVAAVRRFYAESYRRNSSFASHEFWVHFLGFSAISAGYGLAMKPWFALPCLCALGLFLSIRKKNGKRYQLVQALLETGHSDP